MSFSQLYRQVRNANQKKQERTVTLRHGIPKLNELKEGVLEIRKTKDGLVQYTRYKNQIYKIKLVLE